MPGLSPVSAALGALFSPLMVAGALQHVGLPVPRWLLPAGGALSLVGLMAHLGVENGNIEQYVIYLGIQPALLLLAAWGNTGGPEDIDGSGAVDFSDLLSVISAWGPCAP